jgi:hypothetical protein
MGCWAVTVFHAISVRDEGYALAIDARLARVAVLVKGASAHVPAAHPVDAGPAGTVIIIGALNRRHFTVPIIANLIVRAVIVGHAVQFHAGAGITDELRRTLLIAVTRHVGCTDPCQTQESRFAVGVIGTGWPGLNTDAVLADHSIRTIPLVLTFHLPPFTITIDTDAAVITFAVTVAFVTFVETLSVDALATPFAVLVADTFVFKPVAEAIDAIAIPPAIFIGYTLFVEIFADAINAEFPPVAFVIASAGHSGGFALSIETQPTLGTVRIVAAIRHFWSTFPPIRLTHEAYWTLFIGIAHEGTEVILAISVRSTVHVGIASKNLRQADFPPKTGHSVRAILLVVAKRHAQKFETQRVAAALRIVKARLHTGAAQT